MKKKTKRTLAGMAASALIVAAWASFLIMGVRDPDGGVKALWPIFGIANQLLAAIALCLATTILLKMQLARKRSPAFVLVTLVPLAWLLTVTVTAGVTKIWDANPRIGFLAAARVAGEKIPALEKAVAAAGDAVQEAIALKPLKTQRTLRFNNTVDAWVTGIFLSLVGAILLLSLAEWLRLLRRHRPSVLSETEPVWLPPGALETARPLNALGAAALAFTLIREVSGQADLDRAQQRAEARDCPHARTPRGRQNTFLTATEDRFKSIRRCC